MKWTHTEEQMKMFKTEANVSYGDPPPTKKKNKKKWKAVFDDKMWL